MQYSSYDLMVFGPVRYVLFLAVLLVLSVGCKRSATHTENSYQIQQLDSAISKLQTQVDTGWITVGSTQYKKIDSLENQCIKYDFKLGLSRLYFARGTIARVKERYMESLDWNEKALSILRGSNTKDEINILVEIGDIYFRLGKKRLANDYYMQALEVSDNVDYTSSKVVINDKLAAVFYHQTHYEQALRYYLSTLQLIKIHGYPEEHNSKEMQVYNNIALCYVKLERFDSAFFYYDSSLEASRKMNPAMQDVAQGVIMGNLGHLYQVKGDYDQAIKYLKKNIAINSKPATDNADVVTSYTYLLEIYNELDSTKNFKQIFDTAIHFSLSVKRNSINLWRARLYGIMADRLYKQNNFNDALRYRTMQMNLKDSMERVDRIEDIQDQVFYRQLQQQTKKVEQLEKDNRMQQARVQTYLALAMLVIILLVVAIIGLNGYRKNLKREKDLNVKIASQNEQITLNKVELEQAIEEMKLLNVEKNRLLGMVAHDLRGPIYNITGVVQLLESSPGFAKLSENDAQLVDLIKKSCENALDVINDLLEAAKLDNVGLDGEKHPENLAEVIRSSIRLYENRAQQKEIEIHFSEPTHEVVATIGRDKINRALGNLISNAIKFSHKDTRIDIVLTQTDDNALISVSDEGMGIPLADREIIFDKFTRAKRHGTDGEKPVGLGMSIVKQIVDAHNGRIWLESEVGSGTTFYIELPLKQG